MQPVASTDLAIWLFLQIAANQVLIPLLVITFLSARSLTRHPTVINMCCIWILAGIVFCLLFYSGHQLGPEPPRGLCISQSALISSVPPMVSTALLSLVCYVWMNSRPHRLQAVRQRPAGRLIPAFLFAAPYIVYICFVVIGLQLALEHPDKVNRARRQFYCSIDVKPFNDAVALCTAVIGLASVILQLHLMFTLSSSWKALRRAGLHTGIDLQLIIRGGIFTVYMTCGVAGLLTIVSDSKSVIPDIFAASSGLALFTIFASQSDILYVWSNILTRRRSFASPSRDLSLSRAPTPLPLFDYSLLERKDSEVDEKARLAALHAYYEARVQVMGIEVEVIKRPEDAFMRERYHRGRRELGQRIIRGF